MIDKTSNTILCRCSSIHSIAYSSRSNYASCGGRCRFQGCLTFCELHSRALTVERTSTCDLEIAHTCLRNLQIAHTCYAISRLCTRVMQSQDSENAQHNLEIVQIPRLSRTYPLSSSARVNCNIRCVAVYGPIYPHTSIETSHR